ncbi:MAG: aminotransferase class I/II-fold pyridoxal phosphate-dependent enzyme [Planctomycetota bacterium]
MNAAAPATLNPLAESANAAIAKDCPVILSMLSERGKRFFFPAKGILAQGAEAKQKATFANATIGIATEGGGPMHLACINQYYQGLKPAEIFEYAPSQGRLDLRQAWAAKQRAETPSLGDHPTSLPIVTNALTHGLSLVGDLFLDPGEEALSSDLMWENYNLTWETRIGARISTFPFFDQKLTGFNIAAFTQALAERKGRKLVVALNFPNNPSGYTPNKAEAGAIVNALTAAAQAGTKLVVVSDDAYYGMFFDESAERESLFGRLAKAHPNLLAVKVDGATKEEFVWGLRVGFVTFGIANGTKAVYEALEQKAAGIVRAYISNVSMPGQTIVLKALQDPNFRAQQAQKVAVLKGRAAVTATHCRKPEYADAWDVYPFNSGYFMCLRIKGTTAEAVRQELLAKHGVGTIALGKTELRVAFSCLTEEQIPEVFARIATAVRAVRPAA